MTVQVILPTGTLNGNNSQYFFFPERAHSRTKLRLETPEKFIKVIEYLT